MIRLAARRVSSKFLMFIWMIFKMKTEKVIGQTDYSLDSYFDTVMSKGETDPG